VVRGNLASAKIVLGNCPKAEVPLEDNNGTSAYEAVLHIVSAHILIEGAFYKSYEVLFLVLTIHALSYVIFMKSNQTSG
jgi:hypothetical protein